MDALVAASRDKHLLSTLSHILCQTMERKEWMMLDIKKLTDQWRRCCATISLMLSHGRPTLNSQGLHFLRMEKLKKGGHRLLQRWASSHSKSTNPSQVSQRITASGSPLPKETTHMGTGRALLAQVRMQLPDILQNRKHRSLWRAVINHFSHLKWDQNRSKENHNCTSF